MLLFGGPQPWSLPTVILGCHLLPPSNLIISILLTLYMLIVHSRKRKEVESTIFKVPCEQLKPFVHSKNSKDAGWINLNFLATTSKHDSLHGHSIFGFA